MSRIKVTEKEIFKFDELDESTQDKAIEKLYDINVDHEWWEWCYEDAKTIGLALKYFDLDRNRHATGTFMQSPLEAIQLIKENHGKDCETFKTAEDFEAQFIAATCEQCSRGNEEDCESDCEAKRDEIADDFLKSLLEDYAIMLQHEYEYLTSREAIIETIEANDYEFDENGKLA